ncbi:MAG: glycoside hydrolase family 25 protein [Ruminococcus sp.]|nr:glycoside hydrolase family 25 protein [Ruminococcus sp.]
MEKNTNSKLLIIAFIIISAILLVGTIILGYLYFNEKESNKKLTLAVNTIPERIPVKPFDLVENSTLFAPSSEKKLLIEFGGMGEVWLPLLHDVPLSNYNYDNLRTKNGFKYYFEDSKIKSLVGIDISYHQKNINWAAVKNAGVEFAMIRVGYRGYGDGSLQYDQDYRKNIEGALNNGIKVGVYFFSQALNAEEGLAEANFILDAISEYDITFPVVFDWEPGGGDSPRSQDATVDGLTDAAVAFCEQVKNNNYIPMIYQSRNYSYLKYDLSRLKDYEYWIADLNDTCSYKYQFKMWQYDTAGTVPGIEGRVDLNICFTDYSGEMTEARTVSENFFDTVTKPVTSSAKPPDDELDIVD